MEVAFLVVRVLVALALLVGLVIDSAVSRHRMREVMAGRIRLEKEYAYLYSEYEQLKYLNDEMRREIEQLK